jgi:membrane protein
VVTSVLGLPLAFLWAWWTQHLLLSSRVPWRSLIPGAIATTVGLVGLAVGMSIFLSNSIVSNFDRYGPIGVVFVMMSWMLGFSIVMLGGPMAGHIWHQRHDLKRPLD